MWQTVERKARFIAQVMRGKLDVRTVEDIGDSTLSYAEVKALASGDPLILEREHANAEHTRLKRLERAHQRNREQLRYTITTQQLGAEQRARELGQIDAALARYTDTRGERFAMTIADTTYTERPAAASRAARLAPARSRPDGQAGRDARRHPDRRDDPLRHRHRAPRRRPHPPRRARRTAGARAALAAERQPARSDPAARAPRQQPRRAPPYDRDPPASRRAGGRPGARSARAAVQVRRPARRRRPAARRHQPADDRPARRERPRNNTPRRFHGDPSRSDDAIGTAPPEEPPPPAPARSRHQVPPAARISRGTATYAPSSEHGRG